MSARMRRMAGFFWFHLDIYLFVYLLDLLIPASRRN
jgi:hypothetical protein